MRSLTSKRLRAAYYARYSTDGQEADSIDRQFMVCDAIAKREGFTHIERHRFSDPETSGGTPHRIGYSAMLAAAIRGEFDILVAEDISRLWRNMEMQTRGSRPQSFARSSSGERLVGAAKPLRKS